jgi:hypothetical protein
VRRFDDRDSYAGVSYLPAEAGWTEDPGTWELTEALRSAMRDAYADASDVEMADALENVLDAMSPAEAVNFGNALNQIGQGAKRLAADPAFIQVVSTAAPIAGGALGTVIGGPLGTALGAQLGTVAANALLPGAAKTAPPDSPAAAAPGPTPTVPAPTAPPAAAVQPAAPAPGSAAPPAEVPASAPAPASTPAGTAPGVTPSSVAGGSTAAAQGLVLTQQRDVLRSLLATALGPHGCKRVSGVPVPQVLALLSQVIAQAAADADELMYLEQQPDASESAVEDEPLGTVRSLYADLMSADNLELIEAASWEGLD